MLAEVVEFVSPCPMMVKTGGPIRVNSGNHGSAAHRRTQSAEKIADRLLGRWSAAIYGRNSKEDVFAPTWLRRRSRLGRALLQGDRSRGPRLRPQAPGPGPQSRRARVGRRRHLPCARWSRGECRGMARVQVRTSFRGALVASAPPVVARSTPRTSALTRGRRGGRWPGRQSTRCRGRAEYAEGR